VGDETGSGARYAGAADSRATRSAGLSGIGTASVPGARIQSGAASGVDPSNSADMNRL
jgi:hypothetical protein